LKTVVENDHIFVIKSKKIKTDEEAVERVEGLEDTGDCLKGQDVF
jgi:hypothetical protein